jgi:hypothetical protein
MGDRSPKDNQKQKSQHNAKINASNQKKKSDSDAKKNPQKK